MTRESSGGTSRLFIAPSHAWKGEGELYHAYLGGRDHGAL
jgi:hypothetical protein